MPNSNFEDTILSAEQVAYLLKNAASKANEQDHASAQIMIGVAQRILEDLQVELNSLKFYLEQYSRVEKMLKDTVTTFEEKL